MDCTTLQGWAELVEAAEPGSVEVTISEPYRVVYVSKSDGLRYGFSTYRGPVRDALEAVIEGLLNRERIRAATRAAQAGAVEP